LSASFGGIPEEELGITVLGPAPSLETYHISLIERGLPFPAKYKNREGLEELKSQVNMIFERAYIYGLLKMDADDFDNLDSKIQFKVRIFIYLDQKAIDTHLLRVFATYGTQQDWMQYLKITPQQILWADYQALSAQKPSVTLLNLLKNNANLRHTESFQAFQNQIIFLKLGKRIELNQQRVDFDFCKGCFAALITTLFSSDDNSLHDKIDSLKIDLGIKKLGLSLFSAQPKFTEQWNSSLDEMKKLPIETLKVALTNYVELIKTSTDKSPLEQAVSDQLETQSPTKSSSIKPYCPAVTIYTIGKPSNEPAELYPSSSFNI
jgi:hypothetical protein